MQLQLLRDVPSPSYPHPLSLHPSKWHFINFTISNRFASFFDFSHPKHREMLYFEINFCLAGINMLINDNWYSGNWIFSPALSAQLYNNFQPVWFPGIEFLSLYRPQLSVELKDILSIILNVIIRRTMIWSEWISSSPPWLFVEEYIQGRGLVS